MAYYLTIQKKKGEYQELNIRGMKEFERSTRFTGTSYSLKEIDDFTSKFGSEVELKSKLYDKGIIDLEDITKEISIRMKKNDALEKVKYGLVYADIKKYLDIDYLNHLILSLQNDRIFLEKLVSNYNNSYCNVIAIAEIKNYLTRNSDFNINIFNSINQFFIREVFSFDKFGVATLKYKSLHDLAMFINNYVTKKELIENNISDEFNKIQIKKDLLELQKSKLTTEPKIKKQTKTLKRTKKELQAQPIEGQISFFD